ncbi:MAG TPA: transketolase C-terminal domain-containing protein [Pyrinomonadaceae bacterium]|nr:transketolase C-terminal domain-containing protein [Pyrinomonadaceae bacterium]
MSGNGSNLQSRGGTQFDQLASLLDATLDQPDVVFISADASGSFRLSPQLRQRPGKLIEVGIAEGSAVGIAYGMSLRGYKPFVVGFSTFTLLRGLEAIRSYVCYHNADVTILGGMSGLSNSRDGFMHQSTDDVGILSAIAGMRVLTPSDQSSLELTMREVMRSQGPKFVRLYRTVIELGSDAISLSAWTRVAVRLDFGSDFAVVSYGHVLQEGAAAVRSLSTQGKRGRLVEVLQLEPLDHRALLGAIGDARLVISVEDHQIKSGLGGRLKVLLNEQREGTCKLVNVGLQEGQYGSSGRLQDLLAGCNVDAAAIEQAVLNASS